MERTLHILLLARDPALARELDGALSELPEEMRCAVHAEHDLRRGVEHALTRTPDLVLVELSNNVEEAQRLARDLAQGDGDSQVVMVYRPQELGGDRSASLLIELMRDGVNDFLRRPMSSGEVEDLLRRHFYTQTRGKTTRGRIVSFMGNKGGVGKSTLSLSVALGLANQAPERVLLIDASLQHGAMCEMLGLTPEATISDAARQIDRLDERLLRMFSVAHESGLRVLAAPPNAIDAAPVDDEALARVLSVARRAFDYVIVDTFPLIDSVTVAILDVADLIYVVLNDMVPAVLGTAELLKVLERIGVSDERVRVVLNHSSGGHRGRLQDRDVADRLGRDLQFVVPHSRQVLSATNTGEPYALRAPRWRGFGRAIRDIEREILAWNPDGLQAPNATLPTALDERAETGAPDRGASVASNGAAGEERVHPGTDA